MSVAHRGAFLLAAIALGCGGERTAVESTNAALVPACTVSYVCADVGEPLLIALTNCSISNVCSADVVASYRSWWCPSPAPPGGQQMWSTTDCLPEGIPFLVPPDGGGDGSW